MAAIRNWTREITGGAAYRRGWSIIILGATMLLSSHSWAHKVGEPRMEELPVWRECCGDQDCVPQKVKILENAPSADKLAVNVEGIDVTIDKEKFSTVPSQRTWVCYVNPTGPVSNDNIRCVLYPQTRGTT